ncbi:hypothetical protein VTN00DRAFT_3972 [Thermoascus crustaceus]|uniref:uncharacterized protein n=1 Tax=Thermoascus crustaceus TaxID=5088 RepID=UPI0037440C2E
MSTTTKTTTTTTLVGALPTMTGTAAVCSGVYCPNCGLDVSNSLDRAAQDAQQRIQELEARVKFLSTRAAQTAEKLADYEDEIRFLRSKAQENNKNNGSISSTSSGPVVVSEGSPSSGPSSRLTPSTPERQPHQSRLSTFSSLLPYRRSTNNQAAQSAPNLSSSFGSDTSELQNALSREQSLRKEAESRLSQANSELEELTAQLFSQANEMVAEERKARAKLEERVAILERRDGEKRKRLDRLEKAIERVERVRGLVG